MASLLTNRDSIKTTNFRRKLLGAIRSNCTTNHSVFTVEVLRDLLKGRVPSLNIEKVHDAELDKQPDAVDNVVPPRDVLQRNRVDELIEPQCRINHQEHDGQPLSTDRVWEDLSRVADQKPGPSHIVEHVVYVHTGYNEVATCANLVLFVLGRRCCPDDESEEHASGCDQEQRSATNSIDDEALTDGDDDVEDLKAAVDDVLGSSGCDTDILKDDVEIVRGDSISRPDEVSLVSTFLSIDLRVVAWYVPLTEKAEG